jgi:hypothetical protein
MRRATADIVCKHVDRSAPHSAAHKGPEQLGGLCRPPPPLKDSLVKGSRCSPGVLMLSYRYSLVSHGFSAKQ